MQNLLMDLRYAWRRIGKNPGFSLTVITTLALTVGLSTAVFSVLDAVLIGRFLTMSRSGLWRCSLTLRKGYRNPLHSPNIPTGEGTTAVFSALAGYNTIFGGVARNAKWTSGAKFRFDNRRFLRRVRREAIGGPGFLPGEDEPGRNAVVVLSYEVWKAAFDGKPEAVGSKVDLDGRPFTIVGIMPPGFRFPVNQMNAIYTPLNIPKDRRDVRGNHWLRTIARLKPGATINGAQASMKGLLSHYAHIYPGAKGRRMKLLDMTAFTAGNASATLRLLIYAVCALLAIGCVKWRVCCLCGV